MDAPEPLAKIVSGPDGSRTPCPNDHVRMIVELMRAGGPDVVRQWIAALLLAPEDEREEIVRSVEERMAELYIDEEPAGVLEVEVAERKAKSSAG